MPILYTSRDFGQPIPDLEIRNASKVIGYQTPLFLPLEMEMMTWSNPDYQDRFGKKPICWAAGQGYEAS